MKRLTVKERGFSLKKGEGAYFSNYVVEGIGLTFTDFVDNKEMCSFMVGWEVTTQSQTFTGNDIYDLLDLLKKFIKDYNLTQYSNTKKDILVIYTNELKKLYCYLYNYVSNAFIVDRTNEDKGYFQVMDFIEFRQCLNKKANTSKEIADFGENLFNIIFSKYKIAPFTESGVSRKIIKQNCSKAKCTLGKDIFPEEYDLYRLYKGSAHGGICFSVANYHDFKYNMLAVDLKSAYSYCYTLPLPVTAGEEGDTKKWNEYDNFIGEFTITYKNKARQLSVIRDVDDKKFDITGEKVTQTFRLNNIYLNVILRYIKVYKIECNEIYTFEVDTIPKPYLDTIINFFIKKETTPEGEKGVWKIGLNGISGNTIRNLTFDMFKNYSDKELPPQWGSFLMAYCFRIIVEMGEQVDGWVYSDTDSIYCLDTPKSVQAIKEYNKKAQAHNKWLCEEYGYNFEVLKYLGNFIIEKKIIRFRAIANKQYAYKCENGAIVVKAAGCVKQPYYSDEVFESSEMPIGNKVIGFEFINEPHTIIKYGKKYYSETSYFEVTTTSHKMERAYVALKSFEDELNS